MPPTVSSGRLPHLPHRATFPSGASLNFSLGASPIYRHKGRSETNVLDSILDELESNIEEGTTEKMEDLKDKLCNV